MSKLRKVTIIGSGNVGSHCGQSLAIKGIADIIIFNDIKKEKAVSEALDLNDALAHFPHKVTVRAGEIDECEDSDVVIISAGPLPRPDQDRLDTLSATIDALGVTIEEIVNTGFKGIFLCISNPADVIADYVRKVSGFPRERVFGTGTSLDSLRLKRIIAQKTGFDIKSVQAYSMGEHGGSQIIPWSHVYVGGKPIGKLSEREIPTGETLNFDQILEETRYAGYSVLSGKGSTEFGISSAVTEIIRAILHDEKCILPVSVLLDGEYGLRGVHAGVPAVIGSNGAEGIIEIDMTENEKILFDKSCAVIEKHIKIADGLCKRS